VSLGPERRRELAAGARAELARRSLIRFVEQAWPAMSMGVPFEPTWHIAALSQHLQRQLEDRAAAMASGVPQAVHDLLINIPPRTLKPCWEGGIVVEKRRGMIALRDVCVGDHVLTHAGRFRRVTAVHEQGVLPLWELRTARGRIVRVAGDHPVLTQRGWVRADQVTTRDVLAEVHATEESGAATVAAEEARLLGYLIGDGCLSWGVKFTNADPETLDDFTASAGRLGFATSSRRVRNTFTLTLKDRPEARKGRARGMLGSVRTWLRAHGLDKTNSYTKRVPARVKAGDRDVVIEYLAAYWACDGAIHDRRDLPRSRRDPRNQGTSSAVRISATTVSEGLARDHQALLSRLGLSFRLRRHENPKVRSKKQDGAYVSWDLNAADQDTAAKFMQIIGPRMRHEKRRRAPNLERTSFDRVLVPDPVVSAEPRGEASCRCLSVENDHSFVYEGVAVHNSTILSCATAWAMLRWPSIRIGCLSVNPRVSYNNALQVRTLIQSRWYQSLEPGWKIRDEQGSVSAFGTTAGGLRMARGFDSNVVGEGFDWLIVDDPHDPRDTEYQIQQVLDGWDVAVASRVTDARYSIRTCVMQRVRELDFSSHVLAQGWGHLCLPMEFEPDRIVVSPYGWRDPRTTPGEVLHPARFPPSVIDQLKRERRSYGWAAQYQQRPAPIAGGIIQRGWFGRFTLGELPSKLDWTTISVDATYGAKSETADNVGLLLAAGAGARRFVLADGSRRMSFLETIAAIKAWLATFKVGRVLIERAAAGGPIAEVLRSQLAADPHGGGVVVEEVPVRGNKRDRVIACLPQLEAGNVLLLDGADWINAFIDEHAIFPAAAHDDRVDALSQLLIRYAPPALTARSRWAALSRT
jgi:predicted phage terminase large subunit-like protein